ncbi:DUF1236 domain-containing protein [Hyphomicrobium sp. ghe19]|uniref:DUF1236 domain-containing protein n=1 Tax=Hyphomicrobium sp. ghe19 TaxID=2682968 RepID=UPI0013670BCF|nr:hypothetical protein HYPP_03408 [Hyphomicrobium sp. ghe19]
MLKYSIAALALVAGSTFALADPNNGAGPSSPGAGGGAAMERSGGSSMPGGAMKESGGSSKELGGQMKEDRSSRDLGPGSAKKNSASDEGARDRAKSHHQQASDRDLQGKDRQAKDEDRNAKSKASDRADRDDRGDKYNDKSKNDRSSTGKSEGTEGKGGAKGSLTNVSPEQKTRVRSAFASHRVAPAHNLGVSVNVGVVIPRSVHVYAVPADIVTIVPEYREYRYFMIDEDHVAIVDPDTLEVVDIIVVA